MKSNDGGVFLLSAYSTEPPWSKVLHRVLYILRYALVSGIGALALSVEPDGYFDALGWVLILSGLLAVGGVVTDHYRYEWVALGPMISALLTAGIIVSSNSDAIVVLLVFVLAIGLSVRFLFLTNLAARLRALPGKLEPQS